MYLSHKLINQLSEDKDVSMSLVDREKAIKIIRDYFIQIHNEAVNLQIMASNKKNYVTPQFLDK